MTNLPPRESSPAIPASTPLNESRSTMAPRPVGVAIAIVAGLRRLVTFRGVDAREHQPARERARRQTVVVTVAGTSARPYLARRCWVRPRALSERSCCASTAGGRARSRCGIVAVATDLGRIPLVSIQAPVTKTGWPAIAAGCTARFRTAARLGSSPSDNGQRVCHCRRRAAQSLAVSGALVGSRSVSSQSSDTRFGSCR